MSFLRPELAARLRRWRESLVWAALLAAGLWLVWRGYGGLAPLPFLLGLLLAAAGLGLLRGSIRRLRLSADALDEGVVVIDEARIAYLGPRQGGVVDLPAVITQACAESVGTCGRVTISTRTTAGRSTTPPWRGPR